MFRSIILSRAAVVVAAIVGVFIAVTTTAYAAPKITDITMSNSDGGAATDTFTPTTAKIFVNCNVADVAPGTKVSGKWIAVDTHGAAPPNYLIGSTDYTLKPEMNHVLFALSKPNSGFPVGSYRIDIFVNGDLAKSVKFSVGK